MRSYTNSKWVSVPRRTAPYVTHVVDSLAGKSVTNPVPAEQLYIGSPDERHTLPDFRVGEAGRFFYFALRDEEAYWRAIEAAIPPPDMEILLWTAHWIWYYTDEARGRWEMDRTAGWKNLLQILAFFRAGGDPVSHASLSERESLMTEIAARGVRNQ